MLSQNPLVHIDEDELLEELEALTSEKAVEPEKTAVHVISDGVIKVDGEIIELPSVPQSTTASSDILEDEDKGESSKEKELIAE